MGRKSGQFPLSREIERGGKPYLLFRGPHVLCQPLRDLRYVVDALRDFEDVGVFGIVRPGDVVAVKGEELPCRSPRLADMVRLIAQLGGYINRPGRSDPPGPQTIWLGLQRMRDLAWAWDLFGPGAKKDV